jgi:hypothetical protein
VVIPGGRGDVMGPHQEKRSETGCDGVRRWRWRLRGRLRGRLRAAEEVVQREEKRKTRHAHARGRRNGRASVGLGTHQSFASIYGDVSQCLLGALEKTLGPPPPF